MDIESGQSELNQQKGIFSAAFRLYGQNLFLILGLLIFGYGLLVADPLLHIYYENSNLRYIPFAGWIGCLLSFWANIALIRGLSHRYHLQRTSGRECLIEAKGTFWSYVLYTGLYYLIVALGLILGVIPGIYLGVVLSFVIIATVLEGKDVSPFRFSRILARGNFLKIALLNLAVWIPYLAVMAIPYKGPYTTYVNQAVAVGLFALLLPLFFSLFIVLYHQLRDEKEKSGELSFVGGSRISGLPAFLSSVGVAVIFLVLFVAMGIGYRRAMRTEIGWQLLGRLWSDRSDKVIFSNGVTLDAPSDWFVSEARGYGQDFYLSKYSNKNIKYFKVGTSKKKSFFPSGDEKEFKNESYADWIWNSAVYGGYGKEAMKQDPITTLQIGDRTWAKYAISYKDHTRWEYYFTALEKDVISVIIDLNPKKLDKIKLETEMDEVKSILATLKQTSYSPSSVGGNEMEPMLKKDDKVLQLDYAKDESPKRGDIVSYKVHPNENKTYTLRVVGLPGETIEVKKGNIYINGSIIDTPEIPKRRKYSKDSAKKFGQPFHIPKDHYFVLPDNNTVLLDRAYFGPIHREKILSKTVEVYFPRKHKKTF